jgi:hypothetical protein
MSSGRAGPAARFDAFTASSIACILRAAHLGSAGVRLSNQCAECERDGEYGVVSALARAGPARRY